MSDTNFNIPKSLKDALKAGEVVPFVGAGVSMSVKKKNADGTKSDESLFSSWKEFIEILVQSLRDELNDENAEFVLLGIKTGKLTYLDALQTIQEDLGNRLWYQLFEENFDKSKSEAAENSFKLYELIWKLSKNLVITTNVDRVFQWTCPQPSEFRILDVQNSEYAQLQKERFPKRPTVWYLHGHIDNKEKVVFTREQFESFYKERENEAKLQTLLNFLTQQTFLFIGFSLDDAYLREQMEYIHQVYKGGADSFYILLHKSEVEKANLPKYVKAISFSDFGKPLEDLVEELVRIAKGDGDNGNGNSGNGKMNSHDDSKSIAKKPFFNIPFGSKGGEFVGREGKIEDIWERLNQTGTAAIGQAVSVKGFGGLGKTQLAVEYAHAKRGEYKNGVFWMVADQPVDVQLLTIGDELGWTANVSETVNQLDAAKAGFRSLSDCLILFDNVESYDEIKDYLPKANAQTHILITSRERIPQFHQFDLELLEREEARRLLMKISKRSPNDKIELEYLEKILEVLGDIPLAVELVGGYLAEHELITFEKYHQFLDEVPLEKLEKEFPEGSFTNHDRSIIQTLRISEKTIKEKPLMVEILKILAWSGSSSMGTSLLKKLVEAEDDFEFENALNDAHKLRLLKKDEDGERFAIHRLLAKVIQFENPLKEQNEWHKQIVNNLEIWFNTRNNKFEYLAEFEAEIEHLESWQEQTFRVIPAESVVLLQLRGNVPKQRGIYQKAFNFCQEALDLYEKEKLTDENLLANLQNDLGISYGNLGKHKEALKYKLQALEFYRQIFGENHPHTASSLNNVANSYGKLGKHEEALKYQLQALEIRRQIFGENHPDTATSLNDVGYTYGELGKHKEALKYKLQALEFYRQIFGENHPHTAISLNNVGSTHGNLGNHKEALKYHLQSLEIRCQILGENHPHTATSLNNVGHTYRDLGKYKEALKYQLQALEIRRQTFGENHPDTASSLNNVGGTYGDLGKHDEALKYKLQSLEIRRQIFGENHPDTASSLNNVGYTYGELGKHEEALKYKLQSLEIHQKLLGKQHPNTFVIAINLINTFLKLGNNEEAGRKAAEFFEFVPQNHPYWQLFEEISRPYRDDKDES